MTQQSRGDATQPAAPIVWPEGFRSAANLGFDLDSEDVALTVDRGTRNRLSVMSHQAYGALTGVPRVLALLERYDVRATFFAPGYTVERYPDLLKRIRDAGHEIAHHGYMHEAMAGLSYEEEAAVIDRGLEALDSVLGVRPVGYRAPLWETSYSTAEMLLDRGFLYDSSLMDSDLPYELAERPGEGGAIPHRDPGLMGAGRLGAVRIRARGVRPWCDRGSGQGAVDVAGRTGRVAPLRVVLHPDDPPLPQRQARQDAGARDPPGYDDRHVGSLAHELRGDRQARAIPGARAAGLPAAGDRGVAAQHAVGGTG